MKILLRLSIVLCFVFFMMALVTGMVVITSPGLIDDRWQVNVFLIYAGLVCLSTAVLATTCSLMLSYIPNINRLDQAIKEYLEKSIDLEKKAEIFKELIIETRRK